MRQRAVVIEADGREAVIEVSRATMCDGCERHGGCEGHCEITGLVATGGKMRTRALNSVSARPGDTVEVETESRRVLGYAALVFLLPIIICGALGYAAHALWRTEAAAVIGGIVGFAAAFAAILLIDRRARRRDPDIAIVEIVSRAEPCDD